jgi:hypothetical protein
VVVSKLESLSRILYKADAAFIFDSQMAWTGTSMISVIRPWYIIRPGSYYAGECTFYMHRKRCTHAQSQFTRSSRTIPTAKILVMLYGHYDGLFICGHSMRLDLWPREYGRHCSRRLSSDPRHPSAQTWVECLQPHPHAAPSHSGQDCLTMISSLSVTDLARLLT